MLDECLQADPEKNKLIKEAIEKYASQNFYQSSTETIEPARASSSGSAPSRVAPPVVATATAPVVATAVAANPDVAATPATGADAVGQRASRKRKTGDVEFPERFRLKTMKSGKDKLLLINRLGLVDDNTMRSELTGGALTFAKTTIKSVRGCFKYHCQESVDGFVAKWGDFAHSSFHTRCKGIENENCGSVV